MSHPHAQYLLDAIHAMVEMDFSATTGVKFISKFRHALIQTGGFSVKDAELIVSSVEVTLPDDSLSDEQIRTLANSFAIVVRNLRLALVGAGFVDSMGVLVRISSQLKLSLS